MADYSLKLTPSIRNIDSEGSLDTSILNGESIQRTVNILEVVDGSGNKKVIGVVKDGQSFNDIVEVSTTPTPEPTPTPAATLYFNGAVDGDWAEVGNWWLDDEHTEPAGRLPTSADSAVVSAGVTDNSGGPVTVANLTMESALLQGFEPTVTGVAIFNGGSVVDGGGLIGNAIFNSNSGIAEGEVTGNVVFNDTSFFSGDSYITGNATFNDNARMDTFGDVSGTATFTGSACYVDGTAGTFVPDPPPSCE